MLSFTPVAENLGAVLYALTPSASVSIVNAPIVDEPVTKEPGEVNLNFNQEVSAKEISSPVA